MSTVVRIVSEATSSRESVNVWHFRCPESNLSTEVAAAISAVDTFYEAIKALLTIPTYTHGTRVVTVDKDPNIVVPSTNLTTTTTGTGPAVLSACIVASITGTAIGPRYRGRVYLGPIAVTNLNSDSANWNGTPVGTVSTALATLVGTHTAGIELGIWSRKYETFEPATGSSVGTAVGTQRRRLT